MKVFERNYMDRCLNVILGNDYWVQNKDHGKGCNYFVGSFSLEKGSCYWALKGLLFCVCAFILFFSELLIYLKFRWFVLKI